MTELPNAWEPRFHQWDAWDYLLDTERDGRVYLIWHRRAGKDSLALNATACLAHMGTPGTYWHLLPTQVQARKVVWNGIDFAGRRIIDQAFPPDIRASTSSQEMFIRFKNGSAWQLGGSDHYDSLVGSNVRGVVFSEWAICDPQSWNYIRPILLENGGWAMFITTPRGRNHCWQMFEQLKDNERWHVELRNVEQTKREDGSRIFTDEMLEQEREDGMSEEMIQQEYYCSFAAGVVGSYYGREMERAYEDGRVGEVPHNQLLPVHTYWDIGIDDSTAIWYGQRHHYARQWIEYEEFRDTPLLDIYKHVAEKRYRYGIHHFPHDARQRNKDTGVRSIEYADEVLDGRGEVTIVPQHSVEDGIEATRHLINQSWFDEEKCERGIHALMNYRKVWDEKRQAYQLKPLHDWASHGADALRQAGMVDVDEPIIENVMDYSRARQINVIRSV